MSRDANGRKPTPLQPAGRRQLSIPVEQVIANLQEQYAEAERQRVTLATALGMILKQYGEMIRDDDEATVRRVTLTDEQTRAFNNPTMQISFTPDHSIPGVHFDVIDTHVVVEGEIV